MKTSSCLQDPEFFTPLGTSSLACHSPKFLLRDQGILLKPHQPQILAEFCLAGYINFILFQKGFRDFCLKFLLQECFYFYLSIVFLWSWRTKHCSFPRKTLLTDVPFHLKKMSPQTHTLACFSCHYETQIFMGFFSLFPWCCPTTLYLLSSVL